MTALNKKDLVYVPAISANKLTLTPVVEMGITVAYTVSANGETVKFTVNGFEIDENGNETTKLVAWIANDRNCELLSSLYGEEFESNTQESLNSNILIADCLRFCKIVPCLFSNEIYNNEITLDNCDCMGFVVELPSAETEFKYVNLVDGKKYEYAVLFDNNSGDTITIA